MDVALGHRYKHSVRLYRRTVDGSVIIHSNTSFPIFYISLIVELICFIFELQAWAYSSSFIYKYNTLKLNYFQIIGDPQPAVIILFSFFKIQFLAVSKRPVLRVIEKHILHAEPFC